MSMHLRNSRDMMASEEEKHTSGHLCSGSVAKVLSIPRRCNVSLSAAKQTYLNHISRLAACCIFTTNKTRPYTMAPFAESRNFRGWWTSKTSLEQKLIVLTSILFILSFCLMISTIVLSKKKHDGGSVAPVTTIAPVTTNGTPSTGTDQTEASSTTVTDTEATTDSSTTTVKPASETDKPVTKPDSKDTKDDNKDTKDDNKDTKDDNKDTKDDNKDTQPGNPPGLVSLA